MTRVTRLPGDHSQVGWLPPSSVPYHYSEKDSSPLTRGKLAARQRRVPQAGFIPAHAGKTRWLRARSPPKRAHSRSRGENSRNTPLLERRSGSSPLTRGKLVTRAPAAFAAGLIPTHAGKTGNKGTGGVRRRAHPHSRGENDVGPGAFPSPVGSSPLTQGKPGCVPGGVRAGGLVPAHAGKTGVHHLPG